EVVRTQIDRRQPFADGHLFGRTGAYEIIAGRLFFEVSPQHSANARITDLKRAPRNERGSVEFWSDFFLLTPTDPTKSNGRLIYDVHNRGNKLALWTFNEGLRTNEPATLKHAGNGFLLRAGYTLLWTGWNGDVAADGTGRLLAGLPVAVQEDGTPITARNYVEISVDEETYSRPFFWSPWGTPKAYPAMSLDNADAVLTMRPARTARAVELPRDRWAFARWENDQVTPDATSVYVKQGLRPGWLYELVYTAQNPRVSGLGLAGLRDAVSFFRFSKSDASGLENPLAGAIDSAYIFGISQSGRLVHHFLYDGLNVDSANRSVFDGAIIHVSGAGKGLFNYRFAMATVYGTCHRGNLYPSDFFPFAPMAQVDSVTDEEGDSLSRLRKRGSVPKVFFVQTGTEYWSRAASLLHTDVTGKRDLVLDPNVRIYSIAGTQHLGGGPTDRGICQHPRNPLKHRGPILRALLVAMDRWVSADELPPSSRYPRIADGTLVDLTTFRKHFPQIPGVELPMQLYRPLRLDPGPSWDTDGIATAVPPIVGPAFQTLVPAVDQDGNELAGIRLPDVEVPLATYMGWNLRAQQYGAAGVLAGLHGSYIELPKTLDERRETNDPRLSIHERYPTREVYLAKYADAVLNLHKVGFLLEEDALELLKQAAARKLWSPNIP
ncbi:MAG: alpha/beta hydrolase domain-containing protein, partial [Pirellulaceae bacterium]|nr:alpha/beta hydrolase domain-containing protein [Pirellulaceae bacterium]